MNTSYLHRLQDEMSAPAKIADTQIDGKRIVLSAPLPWFVAGCRETANDYFQEVFQDEGWELSGCAPPTLIYHADSAHYYFRAPQTASLNLLLSAASSILTRIACTREARASSRSAAKKLWRDLKPVDGAEVLSGLRPRALRELVPARARKTRPPRETAISPARVSRPAPAVPARLSRCARPTEGKSYTCVCSAMQYGNLFETFAFFVLKSETFFRKELSKTTGRSLDHLTEEELETEAAKEGATETMKIAKGCFYRPAVEQGFELRLTFVEFDSQAPLLFGEDAKGV